MRYAVGVITDFFTKITKRLPTLDQFKDILKKNQDTIKAVAGGIVGALTPAVVGLGLAFSRMMLILAPFITVGAMVGANFDKLKEGARSLGVDVDGLTTFLKNAYTLIKDSVIATLTSLSEWFTRNKDAIMLLVDSFRTNLLPVITTIYNYVKDYLIFLLTELKKWWNENNDAVVKIASTILKIAVPAFKFMIEIAKILISAMLDVVGVVVRFVADVIVAFEKFFSKIGTVVSNFEMSWSGAWDAIVGVGKAAMGLVIDIVESQINRAIGLINTLIRQINKIPGVNITAIGNVDLPDIGSQLEAQAQVQLGQTEGPSLPPSMANRSSGGGGTTININGGNFTSSAIVDEVATEMESRLSMQAG